MNKRRAWLIVALVGILGGLAPAQEPDYGKLMSSAIGALARLEFKYKNELMPTEQGLIGQAICIDAGRQVFMTYDIPSDFPENELSGFELSPPGGAKSVPAELMGRDIEEGLSFLTAKGGKWSALAFAPVAKLKVGDRVVSVGLLGPNSGDEPYLGTGIVAADLALPNEVIYISGGNLTNRSSPVMNAAGQVVGIVGNQNPMEVTLNIGGGRSGMALLAGRQETNWFVPVDEFAHVLRAVPTKGNPRRLAWLGVLNFEAVTPTAAVAKGVGDKPAVIVGKIVPNTPAAEKLKQGDVLIAVDGQPLEKLATPVLTLRAFARDIVRRKPGTDVKLTILRDEKPQDITVKVVDQPTRPHEVPIYYNKLLGMGVRDLVVWDRYQGAEPLPEGVAVIRVLQNSPAATGQVRQGDLITAVNNTPTPEVATFQKVLEPLAKPGQTTPITFLVQRGGQPEALSVRVPREAPVGDNR